MNQPAHQRESVRQHFDALPYPYRPLEESPQDDLYYLGLNNIVIPYYRRYKTVINSSNKVILDAGCGTGYKLLALALANPQAKIVGVDLSEKSIAIAQQRLEHHQLADRVELHCLSLESLSQLDDQFDYINCDEVLYLLDNPVDGLKAMQAVLKPTGIIRVNMHSSAQRFRLYLVQQFFAELGLLNSDLTTETLTATRQTMTALQNWVLAKQHTWEPDLAHDDEQLAANYLLRGDKGVSMAEFSSHLKAAALEFIGMVNWRQWDLEKLFAGIEELPMSVAFAIAEKSIEEQIYLFELLHPVNRLLDIYCGHPWSGPLPLPSIEWTDEQWLNATVYFHPQLCRAEFRAVLTAGARKLGAIAFDKFLEIDGTPVTVDSAIAACLYPLIDGPQTMAALVRRWLTIRPVDLITAVPTEPQAAFETMRGAITELEAAGYVLLESR
ncbi:MAG: class I SAM-dependent methyltransferase [Leptolyngbyaceae cyanobacterium]